MTNQVRLSVDILFKILRRTSYYDTLTLGAVNDRTRKIVDSARLWKKKLECEKGLSADDTRLNISNWPDYYLLMTDRVGGTLSVPTREAFDDLVHSTLITNNVFWLVTEGGLVYSLLRGDTSAIWTASQLTQPVRFIRRGESDYSVLAVTSDNNIHQLKAANRGARMVFDSIKRRITDLFYDQTTGTIVVLLDNGSIVRPELKSLSRTKVVALLSTPVGPLGIVAIRQQTDGSYLFGTVDNGEYHVSSGAQRLKNSLLVAPNSKKHPDRGELPESPVEVNALDTATVFEPLSRELGAEYDREGDFDFIDEELITSRELFEGSDVG